MENTSQCDHQIRWLDEHTTDMSQGINARSTAELAPNLKSHEDLDSRVVETVWQPHSPCSPWSSTNDAANEDNDQEESSHGHSICTGYSDSSRNNSKTKTTQYREYHDSSENSSLFFGRNDYHKEIIRYRTFDHWPGGVRPDPLQLVGAGLYFTGVRDVTKCFSCGTAIEDWEAHHDAMTRHMEANPYCPFTLGYGDGNVPDPHLKLGAVKALNRIECDSRICAPPSSEERTLGDLKKDMNRLKTVSPSDFQPRTVAPKPTEVNELPAVIMVRTMGYEESRVQTAIERLGVKSVEVADIKADQLLDELFAMSDEEGS